MLKKIDIVVLIVLCCVRYNKLLLNVQSNVYCLVCIFIHVISERTHTICILLYLLCSSLYVYYDTIIVIHFIREPTDMFC